MIWGPHLHLVSLIKLYNEIFLVKDMQRVHFGEGAQTTFWIRKLELSPKFEKVATMTQL
jgi:hypothetical protein